MRVTSEPISQFAALVVAYSGSVRRTALTGWNHMLSSASTFIVNQPELVALTTSLSAVAMFAGDWYPQTLVV